MTATLTPVDRLHFTGDEESDRLLATDPLALLIGFALDQQVTVQKAFSGPAELRRRIGHLDAAHIAAMDPEELGAVFRQRPALHRFPGAMAKRVQALCALVAREYGGDAARIWTEAHDGRDLRARLMALPSFGDMKVRSMLAVLAKRFGVQLPGLDEVLPRHPTLGDVDSAEALERYQAAKRAYKADLRAAGRS
ncbi:MAG TPA: HhH-GPD-type base excision DNA repair protein [Candidatus Dormibacteraeota bacterium]|nr:HhH-GPD-type base excision DNA repair protein [Candidatus Dormibacteraeota bacterium]